MAEIHGWDVFSTINATATTSNTVLYSNNTWGATSTPSYPKIVMSGFDPLLKEAALKPEDPLAWLHRRVGEVTDMGRLN